MFLFENRDSNLASVLIALRFISFTEQKTILLHHSKQKNTVQVCPSMQHMHLTPYGTMACYTISKKSSRRQTIYFLNPTLTTVHSESNQKLHFPVYKKSQPMSLEEVTSHPFPLHTVHRRHFNPRHYPNRNLCRRHCSTLIQLTPSRSKLPTSKPLK